MDLSPGNKPNKPNPAPACPPFEHPATKLVVEFVAWPVTVGDEVVHKWSKIRTSAGTWQVLTPTPCIKDRLAAFFSLA
jgi:hypothetical protein